ncbi:hypothetical protein DF186_16840, partial [Enterococcus hirae]
DFDNFELQDSGATSAANADKSITRTCVGTGKTNAIQWDASLAEQLVIGTTGAEFAVFGEDENFLTPAGTVVKPSTGVGSKHIQPVIFD